MSEGKSTDIKIQQLLPFQTALQVLSYTDRTYTDRSTGKQQITDFQCYKLTDIRYDIVYLEKHVRRTAILYLFTVNQQVEVQILNILISVYGDKFSDSGR